MGEVNKENKPNTGKMNDTPTQSSDLLACPFCGWRHVKYFKNPNMWEGMIHEIHCVGCATVMSDYSLGQVTKKWNARFEVHN